MRRGCFQITRQMVLLLSSEKLASLMRRVLHSPNSILQTVAGRITFPMWQCYMRLISKPCSCYQQIMEHVRNKSFLNFILLTTKFSTYSNGSFFNLIRRDPTCYFSALCGSIERPRVQPTRRLNVCYQVRLGDVQA